MSLAILISAETELNDPLYSANLQFLKGPFLLQLNNDACAQSKVHEIEMVYGVVWEKVDWPARSPDLNVQ